MNCLPGCKKVALRELAIVERWLLVEVQLPGGTPYGLYRYVRPQRLCFFSHFCHKKVSNLADSGHK